MGNSPCGFESRSQHHGEVVIRGSGEAGRRASLRGWWIERSVWVRLPPSAPQFRRGGRARLIAPSWKGGDVLDGHPRVQIPLSPLRFGSSDGQSACSTRRRPQVRFLLEPHQHVSMARAAKALGCKPSEAKASSPVQVLVLPHSLISGRGEAGRRAGLRTRWGGSPV